MFFAGAILFMRFFSAALSGSGWNGFAGLKLHPSD